MSKVSLKHDLEKFDGVINFGLWQVQVRDYLTILELDDALDGPPHVPKDASDKEKEGAAVEMVEKIDDEWRRKDRKAASQIRLLLAKNILANVALKGVSTAKELWEKLESLYMSKTLSNRIYLKEQFHLLHMEENTSVSDHMSVFNSIISGLESVGEELTDEDKALKLVWSLPSSYKHLTTTLLYGKETISLAEVTSALISEEIRGRNRAGSSMNTEGAFVAYGKNSKGKKKFSGNCWKCGKSGHSRSTCTVKNVETGSANGSNGQANHVGDLDDDLGLALLVSANWQEGWCLDSCATEHLCANRSYFTRYEGCGGYVFTGDGSRLLVKGVGTIRMRMFDGTIQTISGVKHVPGLKWNLISLSKLDSLGYRYSCQGGVLKILKESTLVMKGIRCRGLYTLLGDTVFDSLDGATPKGKSMLGSKGRMTRKWVPKVVASKGVLDGLVCRQ